MTREEFAVEIGWKLAEIEAYRSAIMDFVEYIDGPAFGQSAETIEANVLDYADVFRGVLADPLGEDNVEPPTVRNEVI